MSFNNIYYSKERDELVKRNNLGRESVITLCDSFSNPIFCQELVYDYLVSGKKELIGKYLRKCDLQMHTRECEFGIGILTFQNYIFANYNDSLFYKSSCNDNTYCLEGFIHAASLDLRFKNKPLDSNICNLTSNLDKSTCDIIIENAYRFEPPVIVKIK